MKSTATYKVEKHERLRAMIIVVFAILVMAIVLIMNPDYDSKAMAADSTDIVAAPMTVSATTPAVDPESTPSPS
ncbi:MAG: hypothetical protein HFJ64_05430 [Eggerthellaceae bacterium]|nr:hypothetical protein [Eggerthellaceae bacterium]